MDNSHQTSALKIRVSGYSGYQGEERPIAFHYKEKELRIEEITDSWVEGNREAGGGTRRCFRVKADDKRFYLLFYDMSQKEWFLDQRSSGHSKDDS